MTSIDGSTLRGMVAVDLVADRAAIFRTFPFYCILTAEAAKASKQTNYRSINQSMTMTDHHN